MGNWVEVVQGGCAARQKPQAQPIMGYHYAGHRTLRSAQVKTKLVQRFLQLRQLKAETAALTEEGLLPPQSWTWPEFGEMHMRVP